MRAMAEEDLYEQLVAAADDIYGGARPGTRALHAKGAWCEGTFTATPEAAALRQRLPPRRATRSRPWCASPTPRAIPRPTTPSARPRDRGQAPRRRRRGDRHPGDDHAGVRHPHARGLPRAARAAPARSRDRAARLREARRLPRRPPGGADGGPGHGRVCEPIASFATARLLLAAHLPPRRRRRRADRGALPLDPRRGRGAARTTTRRRRAAATTSTTTSPSASPATARSASSCASSSPPTATRSTTRPPCGPTSASSSAPGGSRSRGRIDDPERDDHIDVFDPLRLPDGVEPSDDPILHARRQAYSVSAYRRWGRERGPVPE